MFRLWHQAAQQQLMITVQWFVIGGLLLLCLTLVWVWQHLSTELTVYVPPDLTHGVVMKAHTIPPALLYSFAFQVWQEIHYWPTSERQSNGEFAYRNHIETYWSYLTPHFRAQLMQDAAQLLQQGQLARTRQLVSLQGVRFDSTQVKQLSHDSWQVTLAVRLKETVDTLTVKDIGMRYALRVVRADISRAHNPYGLVLAGFVLPPERFDWQATEQETH